MASIKAKRFFEPKFMPVDSCAHVFYDTVTVSANPTAGDTLDFRLPAGVEITHLQVRCADLDTNGTPTIVFGVGYRGYKSGTTLTEQDAYFAAAGKTQMQSGGMLDCQFAPIKFDEDVIVQLKIGTASATFAAGDVTVLATCNCPGAK